MVARHRDSQAKDNPVRECMKYAQAFLATARSMLEHSLGQPSWKKEEGGSLHYFHAFSQFFHY